uniref:Uncharacterized protein n=1 Tax=Colletotrichum fructicola (strain Nara gc5) TaxID=1213859 RepID=L2FD61_COLFN
MVKKLGSVTVDEALGAEDAAPLVSEGAVVPDSEGLDADGLESAPVVADPVDSAADDAEEAVEAEIEPVADALPEAVALAVAVEVALASVDSAVDSADDTLSDAEAVPVVVVESVADGAVDAADDEDSDAEGVAGADELSGVPEDVVETEVLVAEAVVSDTDEGPLVGEDVGVGVDDGAVVLWADVVVELSVIGTGERLVA